MQHAQAWRLRFVLPLNGPSRAVGKPRKRFLCLPTLNSL
jgi:hypothetical protein